MANLIAMSIINRKYISNPNELIIDTRHYMNYEDRESEDDTDWADDACVVYHSEILEPSKIRFGALYEIFSSEERCKYGLVELDMEHLGFMYIEADNSAFIAISESDLIDEIYENIVFNKDRIINLVENSQLVFVPLQLTGTLLHKETKEILQRLYEYSLT